MSAACVVKEEVVWTRRLLFLCQTITVLYLCYIVIIFSISLSCLHHALGVNCDAVWKSFVIPMNLAAFILHFQL